MIDGTIGPGFFNRFWFRYFVPIFIRVPNFPDLYSLILTATSSLPLLIASDDIEENARNLTDWLIENGAEVTYERILAIMQTAVNEWNANEGEDEPGSKVTEVIDDGIDGLKKTVEDLFGRVFRSIEEGARTTDEIIRSTGAGIVGDILGRVNEWADKQDNLFGKIIGGITDNTGILGDILRLVTGRVDISVLNNIIIPDEVFDVIVGGIGDILDGERNFIEGIFGTLMDAVRGIFQDQVDEQIPAIKGIEAAIRDATTVEETADEALLDEVKLINDDTEDGTGASMAKGVGRIISDAIERTEMNTFEAWMKGFSEDVFIECTPETYKDWIEAKGAIEGTAGMMVLEFMQGIGKALGLITIGSALGQKELYEFSRCMPWEILEPGDAMAAYHRQLITRRQLDNELAMRGYNESRSETLVESGYQIPDLAALYSMNLRGLPAGADLVNRLRDLGYSPADAESLEALKFYIPPAQDLITMAVREVFNPAIVAKFGQDQDFPEEFAKYAAEQGISRFWAEKYWEAHWVLPSVQMGYEMLHRGVIDEETLKQLLAAQDVMPGWRDALIAISYRPYTRVDIRRMHDVGVLDDEEVYQAYLQLGYDPDKAANMTEFTIRLNRPDPNELDDLEGLTRASVINAYKDGLVTRQQAEELLKLEGIGEVARDVFLTVAELDIDRDERKDEVDTLMTEFENGVKSNLEVRIALNGLPLSTLENEKAQLKLRKISAKKVKLPSKADLDKLFKNALIDADDYEDQLERIGYPDTWIRKYRQLIEGGMATDA